MTFAQAVRESNLRSKDACRPGKTALKGEHRDLVRADNPRRFTGSIDLDSTLSQDDRHRNATRWDYGIGIRRKGAEESAVWIEVHPAHTSEVRSILSKLEWLQRWLREDATALKSITQRSEDEASPFIWLATSSGVHISKNSPEARRLAAGGVSFPRRLVHLR